MTISPIDVPKKKSDREIATDTVKQKLEAQKVGVTKDVPVFEDTLNMRVEATEKTNDMLTKLRAQFEATQKQNPEAGINHPMA